MKPFEIYAGSDASIAIETRKHITFDSVIDLSTATEIEVTVDAPTPIRLTKTGGDISSVTATGFTMTFVPADTESVEPGSYRYQCRATIGGLKHGRFIPDRIKVKASVFVSSRTPGDYGGS